jgi:RecJ-like exonuclease
MLCPRCYGTHVVTVNGRRLPCPECAGVGEIHCCDGLQEQPGECETSPLPDADTSDHPHPPAGTATRSDGPA